MTTVTLFTRNDGEILGFAAKGHAGYADAGEDIVCAAISALTQATEYGLTEVVRVPVERRLNEKRADYAVELSDSADPAARRQAQILLKTLSGSLQAIANDYPRHIRIIFQERR
ncbi:MAG: ribosomal-processing cysteine protease Prp [Clostridia bacterium]|nr:ribosomal-processing cysteine protease Prp [Clostridia bacterium]